MYGEELLRRIGGVQQALVQGDAPPGTTALERGFPPFPWSGKPYSVPSVIQLGDRDMSDRNIDQMLLPSVTAAPKRKIIEQQHVASFLLFGSFLLVEVV